MGQANSLGYAAQWAHAFASLNICFLYVFIPFPLENSTDLTGKQGKCYIFADLNYKRARDQHEKAHRRN